MLRMTGIIKKDKQIAYPFFMVDDLINNLGIILIVFGVMATSLLSVSWKYKLAMVLPRNDV